MDRLDAAFSPMDGVIRFERCKWKGVKCGIGVLCDAQWVWKYDGLMKQI